ncbi:MAG TPA: universal stress protein [Alphaproteobacteria bacterium]|nr:universal stress protein [Alphaproteobacteria bacterium]
MSMDVRKILVPIDYSSDSHQALLWGASLAGKYGAHVLLLHVIPKAVEEVYPTGSPAWTTTPASYYEGMAPSSQRFGPQPVIIDLVEKARSELHDYADNHLKASVPLEVTIAVGKPAQEILRIARDESVDLIVMGTHGRTGLRHLLLGSVAEEVTRHASCPVFTVRIGAEAAS